MKRVALRSLLAGLFMLPLFLYGQPSKMVGRWFTFDDVDGSKKSVVEITKKSNGIYEGTIVEILTGNTNKRCVDCSGEDKDKPILGLKIIKNLKESGKKLSGGTILDPNNGKVYNCTISLEEGNNNQIKLRGSLDKFGLLGRNQT
ncbi:MAG: DUF2147 domain-containing protein [Bacteroidales bacterium]